MILTHWSCSRCKDILQTLKVYKIFVKEDQVDDRWDADKNQFGKYWFGNIENMSPVLHNYKNKTGQELSEFKISSFLSAQYFSVTAAQYFSRKRRSVPVMQNFNISSFIKFKICLLNMTLLQKTKKRYKFQNLRFHYCK